jgi:hypothetical protein
MALSKIQGIEGQVTPNLGRRNLIINGAMQVSQRGTDINDIAADNTYIMDRFLTRDYGGDGTYDYDQSTDVPTATFKNSIKLTCKSASTNTGTYGYSIEQRIEGYNVRQLRLGRSNAQPITVSFWVKSSVAGTYSTGMRTTSAQYSYVTEFALSANTWTYITYTAPALTTALSSLVEDNSGAGILLDLLVLGKQTGKSTSTLNAWQAGNYVSSTNQVAWMDNANATLNVTGVQVEAGDTATPFEHRSYVEELTACQRYCNVIGNDAHYTALGAGTMYTTTNGIFYITTATSMRTTPSLSTIAASSGSNSGKWLNSYVGSTGTITNAVPQLGENSTNGLANSFRIYVPSSNSSTTIGLGTWNMVITGARFILSAEL